MGDPKCSIQTRARETIIMLEGTCWEISALYTIIEQTSRAPLGNRYYTTDMTVSAVAVPCAVPVIPAERDESRAGFRTAMSSWVRFSVGSISSFTAASRRLRIKRVPYCVDHDIGRVSALT